MVDQRCEDHVNMIGHNDRGPQVESLPVMVQTAFPHDGAHKLRKNPPMISAERNEMLPAVALQMRKLSPIKSPRHEGLMWGQPSSAVRGAKLRLLKSNGNDRSIGFGSCINSCPISDWESWKGTPGELHSPGQPRTAVPT